MDFLLVHSPLVGPTTWRWLALTPRTPYSSTRAWPPDSSPATPGADMLDRLRDLAVDGTLPKWSTWWAPDVMAELIPDETRRAQVDAELPEVPIALYEVATEIPTDWHQLSSSFLLLSEAYRGDADKARSLGWSVIERIGGHLDIVSDPDAVAPLIVDLAQTTGA